MLLLGGSSLLLVVGLTIAILVQLDLQSSVVGYAVVVLVSVYAFVHSASWL